MKHYTVLEGGEYPVGHFRFDDAGVGHLHLSGVVYEIRPVSSSDSPGVPGFPPPVSRPPADEIKRFV